MKTSLRIIVTGLIGQYPMGGVSWDYFQYVLGLHKLGHDVYYLEDTGFWPYNPNEEGLSASGCEFNVSYIKNIFEKYQLEDRWMFKFSADKTDDEWFGLSDKKRTDIFNSADLLINVSGCLRSPSEYRGIEKLVYIDSDPMFTQIKSATGLDSINQQLKVHDRLFTFAENKQHNIPQTNFNWFPTRQPIVLAEWSHSKKANFNLSTVMNWTSYQSLHYANKHYGQKDVEFEPFLTLPTQLKARGIEHPIELAVNQGKTSKTPHQTLKHNGWVLKNPNQVCCDMPAYQHYIQSSFAEWSVAKHGYVAGNTGWFSCRSACYLASGRPVIVQDTGFSSVLDCGFGVYPFTDIEGAINAIEAVLQDSHKARTGALDVANTYFDSNSVLQKLIEDTYASISSLTPVLHRTSVHERTDITQQAA